MQKTNRGGNAATETKASIHFFDTMNAVNQLEKAGVPRAQAQADVALVKAVVSEAMTSVRDTVATKADHQVLDGKVETMRETMRETMATKADLSALKSELIIWIVGILVLFDVVNASVESGLINSVVKALIAALGG